MKLRTLLHPLSADDEAGVFSVPAVIEKLEMIENRVSNIPTFQQLRFV
jgi:hypothetical protein